MKRIGLLLGISGFLFACSSQTDLNGVKMSFDPSDDSFFSVPYPLATRLDVTNRRIELGDFPNPEGHSLVEQMIELAAQDRDGFGLLPVVWMRFSGPLNQANLDTDPDQPPSQLGPLYFVNIDPDSNRYGERVTAISYFFERGGTYVDDHTLAFAPWPARTLSPGATYAAVVLRSLEDETGRLLGQPEELTALLAGRTPGTERGEALRGAFAPLRAYIATQDDLTASDIAGATVFRTDNPVARLRADVVAAVERYATSLTFAVPLTAAHDDPDYCYLRGALSLPQFQEGAPPFSEPYSGQLQRDGQGRLQKQHDEAVPVVFTIPKTTMPPAGFPYLEYVHGSGGIASQLVDRGPVLTPDGNNTAWRGPGYIAANRGFAAGGSAMPISPDRVDGVGSFDYIQITNLASAAGNFWQGTIELALKTAFLEQLELDTSLCPAADTGGKSIRFDLETHVTMGQSMGAMYTNMFGAVNDQTKALIPTGSGGYWSYFLFTLEFDGVPDLPELLSAVVGADVPIRHLHPIMGLFQQAGDLFDPAIFAPHLLQDPLPNVRSKHMYVPHGRNDVFFSSYAQRALGLGYGFPRAGAEVDPSLSANLDLFFDFTTPSFPISLNVTTGDDELRTAAQIQYEEDGIQENGHLIAFQRNEVKWQYGCFLESFADTGSPEIFAVETNPDELDPCP